MKVIKYPAKEEWKELVKRPHLDVSQLNATVEGVLEDVRNHGDEAVKRYEEKFDHARLDSLSVSEAEMDEAEHMVSAELKHALELAHHNIARFHESQKFEGSKVETCPLLAVKYRVKTQRGRMLGGPMYALEKGLGWKWLAILFALFAAIASFGIGSTVQANAISTLVENQYGISPYITGAVVCALGAAVIIGGVKSISKVCGMLVPFMALFYVLGCIYILFVNHAYLWPAIKVIFESAFTTRAAGGGFAGSTLMMAARYGIARGLFSNESGLGSAPIVAAAAQTRNPVRQALVSSTGTFWDTVIICALTGLVITSSIIAYPDIDYHNGAALTKAAFSKIPYIGAPLLTFGLATFAFSTTLGWSYYGERCVEYLKGKRWMLTYRVLYIVSIFAGSVIGLEMVWNIADCMNALMAIPNLVSLLCLSGIIVHETRKYLWRDRLDRDMDENEIEELEK